MRFLNPPELTIPILLPGGRRCVTVITPRRLSEDEWAHLLTVLEALKPGLVPADPEEPA